MLTSFSGLVFQLSLIFVTQTVFLFFFMKEHSGPMPFLLSLFFTILYFLLYFFVKKRPINRFPNFSIFMVLLVFFSFEMTFQSIFHIGYFWYFLIVTQILSGYFILGNPLFYLMSAILLSVSFINLKMHAIGNPWFESVLIVFFSFLISNIVHVDRRKTLLNLGDISRSRKEINSRFEQLEESISQVFILCSCDFLNIYYVSSGFDRMFNFSRFSLIKNPSRLFNLVHPGDKDLVNQELKSASKDHSYRELEFRILFNDTSFWLRIKIFPIERKDLSDKYRFVLIMDDISDRKLTELKLAKAKSIDGEFAARIQKNLLFSNPILNIHELDIAAESIPSLDVGGDFFDFYRFSDKIVDIIIADVMGKGMIASLLGAASKSAFMKSRLDLTVADNDIPPIHKIMTMTNQSLSPELIKMGKFITMQYARLNMEKASLTFIDSGHTSLLYYSARQKGCWSLKGWNMPLGFNPEEVLVSSILPFESHDLFFFYSDGVTEAENDEGVQFGERRLKYVLNSSAHLTTSQILSKVRNLVFHYTSSEGFADDLTCIAMKIGNLPETYHRVSSVFAGIRESLGEVRTFMGEFLHENFKDIRDDLFHSLVLAVNEAVANIIEHNYEKNPKLIGREILMEIEKYDTSCYIQLYYDGEEFEWTTIKNPDLSDLKSGGYGLFLIREIMDSVCYGSNIDGVQRLTLVKEI